MSNIKKDEKTITELMKAYKEGNIEARDKIIEHYMPLVEKWAKEYFNLGIDNEDIIASGYEGLLIALTRCKNDSNISRYINLITISTIKDYIASYYGLHKEIQNRNIIIAVLQSIRDLTRKLNRKPNLEEIKENTNYDLNDIKNALNVINKIESKDLQNMTLEELREVRENIIDLEYIELYNYFKKNIMSSLDTLPLQEREKEIIKLRIKGKSLKEVSEKYQVSRERIVQIEEKVLRIIRKSLYIQRMAEGLGGQIERSAIESEIVYRRLTNRVK